MNDRDNNNLKYTDWRASIKGLINEQKNSVRLEIIRLKQQGNTVSQLVKKFNISKPQLYRILENPCLKSMKKLNQFVSFILVYFIKNKERGRKTIIKEDKRRDLLQQLITENGNQFPQRKKNFVKFLKEKQQIQEIPQITNHVKYPEYDRFRALYDQIKDQYKSRQDIHSLQIHENTQEDSNKQSTIYDCDSMYLNLSICEYQEQQDQFFNE
ncbi:resolvase helix turn-helix protein (macronuclear) [Tetrahymena thermophila SB210]|uniref:Resolvase helix turn-helix protein n=1 Tax=Tetrahymena thermophila (strain SB210) TaxID=312017 RepID=W7XH39_TETTS|nr:resolvase helix turn-helix protein [Tetrahymena thermophila SB210]EWS76453.1 resolvase helix turn-helix protein [Tetrahymena thermophila SB210]|eukprot:XP_012651013.1 resolvase helix turn-helix protein [Tetrahymena thermophila SB210]